MKEIFDEQQVEWIVTGLCIALFLAGPVVAWFRTRSWRSAVFFSTLGPLLYFLWRLYNAIENRYGLDSVKALSINAALILGSGLLWALLYSALFDRPRASSGENKAKSGRGRTS